MKTQVRTTLLAMLMAGVAASAAVPVFAQDADAPAATAPMSGDGMQPGPGPRAGFGFWPRADLKQFDKNGDGKITLDEIKAGREAEVKALDPTGDGKLTEEDMVNAEIARIRPMIEARVKAKIAARDVDGDGKLSAAELALPPMPMKMLEKMAADNGGTIDINKLPMGPRGFGPMGGRDGDDCMGPGGRGFGPHGERMGDRMRGHGGEHMRHHDGDHGPRQGQMPMPPAPPKGAADNGASN